nr:MAG TPA: hypothetical protein [Bacteriophage sp.]
MNYPLPDCCFGSSAGGLFRTLFRTLFDFILKINALIYKIESQQTQ